MFKFRYQPTLEDYLRLNRMLLWRRMRRLFVYATGSLLLFLLFPLFSDDLAAGRSLIEAYRTVWVLLILPVLMTVLIVATEFGVRQRWTKVPEVRVDRDYEIDETGLRVSGETFSGSLAWSHLTHSEERNGLFFLSTAQNLFYYFPTTLVSDPAALKALAAQNIPPAKKVSLLRRRIWLVWFGLIVVVVVIALIPDSWFK